MKIGLAIQQVRSAENRLAHELHRVGERHRTDQDIYHLSKKLEKMSRSHIEELDRYGGRYRISAVSSGEPGGLLDSLLEEGSELLDTAREKGSGLLDPVREKGSELIGRHPESGLLLLRDLRKLYMLTSEASINWVMLGQGAQAGKDGELLQTASKCHAETLRQMRWANTKIKEISPQVLTS